MVVNEMSVLSECESYMCIIARALPLLHLQVPSDEKLPFRTVQYAWVAEWFLLNLSQLRQTLINASGRLGQVCELIPNETQRGIDSRANRRRASDCMAERPWGTERAVAKCPVRRRRRKKRSQKQMQGLRSYWSSSRGWRESTVGGSLLSLYVTDQEKGFRHIATVTGLYFNLCFINVNLLSSGN